MFLIRLSLSVHLFFFFFQAEDGIRDWSVTGVQTCALPIYPATGLTSPTTGIVSVYRRPLPATNLGFLSAIMWDGREPTFQQQAIDATLEIGRASCRERV